MATRIPVTKEGGLGGGFDDPRQKRVWEEMESDMERRRREWENEISKMRKEFFMLRPEDDDRLGLGSMGVGGGLPSILSDRLGGPRSRLLETSAASPDDSRGMVVKDDKGHPVYKVLFDVHDYRPDEVSVKMDANSLTVTARHEDQKGGWSSVSREYSRKISIPPSIDPSTLQCTMGPDGILAVEAPIPAPSYTALKGEPSASTSSSSLSSSVSASSAVPSSSSSGTALPIRTASPASSSTSTTSSTPTHTPVHHPHQPPPHPSSSTSSSSAYHHPVAGDPLLGGGSFPAGYKPVPTAATTTASAPLLQQRSSASPSPSAASTTTTSSSLLKESSSSSGSGSGLGGGGGYSSDRGAHSQKVLGGSSGGVGSGGVGGGGVGGVGGGVGGGVVETAASSTFKVEMDIEDFKPEELTVKTQDQKVIVCARREEKVGSNTSTRELSKERSLPDNVDPLTIKAFFTEGGSLIIEAPYRDGPSSQ